MKCEIILAGGYWNDGIFDQIVHGMEMEHKEYYGTIHGARHLDISDLDSPTCGYSAGDLYHQWFTSGGNYLGVRFAPNRYLHILVSGVRHGIPWRFIPQNVRNKMDELVHVDDDMHPAGKGHQNVLFHNYETREPDLAPWETKSEHETQW